MDTILLPIHITILGFTLWNVLKADHLGFNWILGKVKILEVGEVKKYHYRIIIGLGLMILSGVLMFWPMREFLLSRPQFYVKMIFVITLVINSIAISYVQKTACSKTFKSLSLSEKLPLFISGGLSTVAWLGAICGGLYLIPEY